MPTEIGSSVRLGQHMTAQLVGTSDSGKTQRWSIRERDGTELCRVEWYAPWRQYCTVIGGGDNEAVVNNSCHRDLAAFLEKLNREHKEADGG